MNPRLASVHALQQILQQGRNLPDALASVQKKQENPKDRALTQAICYGVCRYYFTLDFILQALLQKPLKEKDTDVHCLLLCGLYQIIYMRVPDHAAVSETVKLVMKLKKNWARGMVNAVLRNYLRQAESLQTQITENKDIQSAHPVWLLVLLKQYWPDQWPAITEANNQPAPMTLRVNLQRSSRDDYLQSLAKADIPAISAQYAESAIRLTQAVDVERLPGFYQGQVSVQDEAAQLAANLLNPQADETILDACAAPGGKTAHILEYQPQLGRVDALEIDGKRLERVQENLQRLGLTAQLVQGDAAEPTQWHTDKLLYDRILLDAPCSATGVIRRHPDIKLLRRADDIPELVKTQQQILNALWPLLRSGGMLLYATCSILAAENNEQVQAFITTHEDARLQPLEVDWGHDTGAGHQILPGEGEMDGFFYACIIKA
ncbi:MAG: 16S rRNA (cytosine(967)-C(5))-methyltransferase RsmB [Gammaproteobacteria bacterium]|nr:16S rRNA (cytosine(967)-C(5))-methyltransferase RsmB [Gammaproteobacteria bacterium]